MYLLFIFINAIWVFGMGFCVGMICSTNPFSPDGISTMPISQRCLIAVVIILWPIAILLMWLGVFIDTTDDKFV
jgi:hypothetical protein